MEELGAERRLSHRPSSRWCFALQTPGGDARPRCGVSLDASARSRGGPFDLALPGEDAARASRRPPTYDADLFDAATVQRMAGHSTRVLEDAGAGPGRRLSEVPLLRDGERAQLLAWNAAARRAPAGVVHELVAEQAARTPDAVAVSSGERGAHVRELERARQPAGRTRCAGWASAPRRAWGSAWSARRR